MADKDKIETRYNFFWIHDVFGSFVKDTLDYFTSYLYPRFEWKIVGTYDKAVEYINKHKIYNRELDQPMRPGLILDPSGDFNFDEKYGKLMYRYPNLSPGLLKYVYEPIYQDENVLITVAFGRVVGEFNFIGLMSSFYEFCDMRVYLNLIFGGAGSDRVIYPQWFNSFLILPPEIYNYTYENDITGQTYTINIPDISNKLIKTTNIDEVVYPFTVLPRYKLNNISDASSRYGGPESLPDWKLNFTIGYEIEIPTFVILESNYLAKKVKVNIRYGSCFTANNVYGVNVPNGIESFESETDFGLDETSNSTIDIPSESQIFNKTTKEFKTRYYHIVTKEESDSTSTIDIEIPEYVIDRNVIKLFGKYGELSYGDHYRIININNKSYIRIYKENVILAENDILEIYVYMYNNGDN